MKNSIPKHIAIIMDGNGRWAIKRKKNRLYGHRAGVERIKSVVEAFLELKIDILSIFAFSTENWKRPKKEVEGIFNLIKEFSYSARSELVERGVKVRTMGNISKLPADLYEALTSLVEETKDGKNLTVNIGINYGGRDELVYAVNKIIASNVKECNEKMIADNLYTFDLPDPDLIIRTSGETRISNFMLFQCAYSELYFPKVYWPDFNKRQLIKAIKIYQKRNRRFGGLKTGEKK